MRVLAVAPIMVVSLAFCTDAAPVPKHLLKPPVYLFPTTIGTKWDYFDDAREWTETVTEVADKYEQKVVHLERRIKGLKTVTSMTVAVTENWVYRLSVGDQKDQPPYCWLKLPASSGAFWMYTWPNGREERNTILDEEEIEVPAGRFKSVRVQSSYNDPSGFGLNGFKTPPTSIYWFAPGIGLVKLQCGKAETVLNSFTRGKE